MIDGLLADFQPPQNRILVVEDEIIIARDIQSSLESLGYQVLAIAISGLEAIEKTQNLRPDLILMDIRLRGDMDGIEAAEEIWKRFRIPIVYATGYSDWATLERARQTAPFGYILKPVEERELYVTIETALQRYRLDRELQAREQWLSAILTSIGDGVIVCDRNGRVQFLNPSAELMTGWHKDDALGQPINIVYQLIDEQRRTPIDSPVLQVLRDRALFRLTNWILLVSRDGQEFPISESAAPLTDEAGVLTGVVIVFRDTTDRRRASERDGAIDRANLLESQMEELQRVNKLKDDFLSTISHELRTPLASIKMAVEMLQIALHQNGLMNNSADEPPSRIGRYLEILRDQCHKELGLVNDILDINRINAEAYQLDYSTVQLGEWLLPIIRSFEDRAHSRQLTIATNIADNLPPLIVDTLCLSRIISELLNNACKYTPPDGVITVSARAIGSDTSIALTEQSPSMGQTLFNQAEISVQNTGVEITTEQQSRVFEQFYRIPSSDRWKQGGTGLGLTLVQKLVTYLGGTVRVESDIEGTSFIVVLPLEPTDSASSASAS